MPESADRPLVSCTPAAIVLLLAAIAVAVGYQLARPLLEEVHDPRSTPRPVTARGDLAADERATIELFKNASPAVVHITTVERARDSITLNPLDIPQSTGSGLIWDERGYVVTNLHVILEGNRFLVTLDDESSFEGRLVGYEADYDIAVLKIDAPKDKLRAIPVGTSSDLQVGQKVFAIGNPFGLDHTLSTGVISGLDREISSPNNRVIRGVVQTDAAINPGNSGGPLLDSAGRLIGMNTAIKSPTHASAGIGFAVPVDTINRVVPGLIRKGRFLRPVLGIIAASGPMPRALADQGVVIGEVRPGGGAEKAGLRSMERDARGRLSADVITSVAGQRVKSVEEIWEVMGEHQPGETVVVEVLRDGKPLSVSVTLQEGA